MVDVPEKRNLSNRKSPEAFHEETAGTQIPESRLQTIAKLL